MAFTLNISMGSKRLGSIKIDNFNARKRENLVKALNQAGVDLEVQIKKNLSGPSHSRFPGNGNPFPGTVTGVLKNTTRHKVKGLALRVGTGAESSEYSYRHELGIGVPKRPYIKPAWDKLKKKIFENIAKQLFGPIR